MPKQQLVDLANQMLVGEEIALEKVAISVFEEWLGKDNLHKLDCADSAERVARDERHLAYWLAIRETFPDILAFRPNGNFQPPEDLAEYTSACRNQQDEGSDCFQCIVIPSVNAIYYENWDDTNVLWFEDRTEIGDLLGLAQSLGLHLIEYA